MKPKASEDALGGMMRHYGYFVHKWRDRGYVSCPKCGVLVKFCPRCKQDMLLEKAQKYPDFLVARSFSYVECKQGAANWSLWDISANQVARLDECPQTAWIFLLIGAGRAPRGKEAYLIEWSSFKKIRSKEVQGYKSVCFRRTAKAKIPEAREVFGGWMLEWKVNTGWIIPYWHPWFDTPGVIDEHTDEGSAIDNGPSTPEQLELL